MSNAEQPTVQAGDVCITVHFSLTDRIAGKKSAVWVHSTLGGLEVNDDEVACDVLYHSANILDSLLERIIDGQSPDWPTRSTARA